MRNEHDSAEDVECDAKAAVGEDTMIEEDAGEFDAGYAAAVDDLLGYRCLGLRY